MSWLLEKIISSVKAEEEEEEEEEEEDLVDPGQVTKDACVENDCGKYKEKLDECTSRVTSKSKTTETCFEEILDFYHCMDHCAAKDMFSKLK